MTADIKHKKQDAMTSYLNISEMIISRENVYLDSTRNVAVIYICQ